jgi:hypothetical protein
MWCHLVVSVVVWVRLVFLQLVLLKVWSLVRSFASLELGLVARSSLAQWFFA